MKKKFKSKSEIDVENFNEVRNAAFSFGVTVQQLKDAVAVVGTSLDAIQQHLKSYRNPYVHRTTGWRL